MDKITKNTIRNCLNCIGELERERLAMVERHAASLVVKNYKIAAYKSRLANIVDGKWVSGALVSNKTGKIIK